jgi:hypothetical protein
VADPRPTRQQLPHEHPQADAFIPVYEAEFKGVPGTIQPLIKSQRAVFQSFDQLLPKEALDIAREHIADWIGSQHDSHIGQWIHTEDCRLICTDKEQGFKYFGKDTLSVVYHPNAVYGERPPLYNAFWKAWAKGNCKLDLNAFFDSFEPLFKHGPAEFEKLVAGYAAACPPSFGKDRKFIAAAAYRYTNARHEFRQFLIHLKG